MTGKADPEMFYFTSCLWSHSLLIAKLKLWSVLSNLQSVIQS